MYASFAAQHCEAAKYDPSRDFAEARNFLTAIRRLAPDVPIHYLEGNHEQRIDAWIARTFRHEMDREEMKDTVSVYARLKLHDLGIMYYARSLTVPPLTVPGFLQLDGCLFLHGAGTGRNETEALLKKCMANVVHGHLHRSIYKAVRTMHGETIIGACPGTLSNLQMFYNHSQLTDWTHGIAYQEWDGRRLWHFNVPIQSGQWKLP